MRIIACIKAAPDDADITVGLPTERSTSPVPRSRSAATT